MYWGKYVAARQQSRRHGPVPRAHAERRRKRYLEWTADGAARPARGADVSLRVDRHGPVQRGARSDHGRRVVDARQERRHGDDEARRARRLDLRVLRRLGAELHVLHRAHAQRDRALLRSAELRTRQLRGDAAGATTTSREWFRPNPPLDVRSSGARATTRTSRSRRSSSRSTTSRRTSELFLENYWLKNKRAVEKGKNGPTYGWVIPADQHARPTRPKR